MFEISKASESDKVSLLAIDNSISVDQSRMKFVLEAISNSWCIICFVERIPAGYVIFNQGFFDQTFLWLLFVSPNFRRVGVASSLIRHIETVCKNRKLFTSTNQSNTKMQNLMDKLGFVKTGYLENLDEGDPEIFYFKKIEGQSFVDQSKSGSRWEGKT